MASSAKTLTVENPTSNGDWKVVLPRRAKQRKSSLGTKTLQQQQQQQQSSSWAPSDFEIDIVRESRLIQKMQICMKKLEVSQFFLTLLDQIQNPEISDCFQRILGSELKMKMVIYGIGSIESYESPRLQLSLAILLRKKFNWIGEIEVFDPVLSATETQVLEALGCSVSSINEQGRRLAQNPTLFFMPHCEAELYNNLLQSNWEVGFLNHIALFGNSFETYEQHVSVFKNSKVAESAKHILSVRKFTDEFRIQTVSDDYFGAFHDSSWHFFRPLPDSGQSFFNTANVVTRVRNFPFYSGTIVGIMKGFLGLSGAILCNKPTSYLLMLALLPTFDTLLLMWFVRIHNTSEGVDKKHLNSLSLIALLVAAYLMGIIIVEHVLTILWEFLRIPNSLM